MIPSQVATLFFVARGGFDFGAFSPVKSGEESPMNMSLQELLQRFESREGEKIQHVLIGSPETIQEVTHTLHALRYAEVGLWSPDRADAGNEFINVCIDAISIEF